MTSSPPSRRRPTRRDAEFDDFFVPQRELATRAPLADGYLASLERAIDWEAVRRSGLAVAVDPLFGTAREFLDRVLLANGVTCHVVHSTKDPYFGGYAPECTPSNLARLRERGPRDRLPASASPPTATPTASGSSTRRAARCRPTSPSRW